MQRTGRRWSSEARWPFSTSRSFSHGKYKMAEHLFRSQQILYQIYNKVGIVLVWAERVDTAAASRRYRIWRRAAANLPTPR